MKKHAWRPRRKTVPLELPSRISNLEDLVQFFAFLYLVDNTNFHPDNHFYGPVTGEVLYTTPDGRPAYSVADAKKRDRLMSQAWELCERRGLDIYGVAMGVGAAIGFPGYEGRGAPWISELLGKWV